MYHRFLIITYSTRALSTKHKVDIQSHRINVPIISSLVEAPPILQANTECKPFYGRTKGRVSVTLFHTSGSFLCSVSANLSSILAHVVESSLVQDKYHRLLLHLCPYQNNSLA